jgi:hypothetical protein
VSLSFDVNIKIEAFNMLLKQAVTLLGSALSAQAMLRFSCSQLLIDRLDP